MIMDMGVLVIIVEQFLFLIVHKLHIQGTLILSQMNVMCLAQIANILLLYQNVLNLKHHMG